jgi:hypothetical protein
VPTLGYIAGGLASALVVTLVFLLWIGWPGFLAVGAGAIFGVAFLVVATSLGDDPRAADEAWRQHAADLVGTRRGSAIDRDPASSPGPTNPLDDAADEPPDRDVG